LLAEQCASMAELSAGLTQGAGAAVVAGEALTLEGRARLAHALEQQPEWSDLPLVVMDAPRRSNSTGGSSVHTASLPHAIVLVRPVHAFTLVSAVRSALLSRARQYQVRDELTERERAEEALRESNDRKDEFLAMLGHELRNPLAAIRNATELMKLAVPADERLRRAHRVLERQSAPMTGLIDGLLEVSRIARGKIRLEREALDARKVIEAILQDHAAQIAARRLALDVELPRRPLWVWADRVRLAQIFDNLIGNAIKFTDAADTIRVTLDEDDGCAVVRVRDTGVGIRAEMLPRLFDPFQQETQDIARAAGGLGLGLALAKGLVELHDGTICAYSGGPGTGAEFAVRLPLTPRPARDESGEQRSEVAPHRVLIVEDNRDAGETLRDLLNILGHDATLVASGLEALATLRRQGVDVVLCDLGLPEMSGYELAQAVRTDASLKETVLVALTGYGQPEDRRRTADAGFDGHLNKPVDLASLNAMLATLQPRRLRKLEDRCASSA
jgi:signal transduction histidine kinase/ActR/RegA family two-component response regulator